MNVADLSAKSGGLSAMQNFGMMSVNPLDSLTITQPSAAGAAATSTAHDLMTNSNLGLKGLEKQVATFYKLYNQAEENKQMIEKFILGTSCKTAGISENCLLFFPSPKNKVSDFI